MIEERKSMNTNIIQNLVLENRGKLSVSGVNDVLSFDVKEVLLETELGMLMLKGEDLHVSRLMLDKGEVDVEGKIDSLTYSENDSFSKKSESLLAKFGGEENG